MTNLNLRVHGETKIRRRGGRVDGEGGGEEGGFVMSERLKREGV